ncbi:MAG: hypothetical protein E6J43_11900 [Chloroflexi bacterium]|nr:MAG: hypothetical protein E6J43_11900 [Chloroflexota bacterium]
MISGRPVLMRHLSLLVLLPFAVVAITAPKPSSAISSGTTRVSVANDGAEANAESIGGSISATGRFVVFSSEASNLVVGDNNNCPQITRGCVDVFISDTLAGSTELINKSSDEVQSEGGNFGGETTPDGQFVTFSSASAALVPGDTNGRWDGFVRDRVAGTTERVTVSSDELEGNGDSWVNGISDDGRFILFTSSADNLVPGDTNPMFFDLFVRDRSLGTTEIITVDKDGGPANSGSDGGVISSDGRFVAFVSSATDLTDDELGPFANVFVRDRLTGRTELVSVASGGGGGNELSGEIFTSWSHPVSISADGRYVAFDSRATDLVSGDGGGWDVFVRDRALGLTSKVSLNINGSNADGDSFAPTISANGRYVSYMSSASDLVPGDTNGLPGSDLFDVFVRDLRAGINTRANVDSSGSEAEYGSRSENGSISGDGGSVAFRSNARNLVPGDNNNLTDVFLRHLGDADGDGAWDPFDTCPMNSDCDSDSVPDGVDNCPNWPNATQTLPPWPVPAGDPDCDGFTSNTEKAVGTAPLAHCGSNAWPADVNNNGFSEISDVVALVNYFWLAVPPALARYDIAPDPPNGFVDITDIVRMLGFFGQQCSP